MGWANLRILNPRKLDKSINSWGNKQKFYMWTYAYELHIRDPLKMQITYMPHKNMKFLYLNILQWVFQHCYPFPRPLVCKLAHESNFIDCYSLKGKLHSSDRICEINKKALAYLNGNLQTWNSNFPQKYVLYASIISVYFLHINAVSLNDS